MVLDLRELNRALLARQLLLQSAVRPVADLVELVVGLQAPAPMPPYYGLRSRLEGFDPHYVPLVQLPPRGVWGRGGQVRYATLEAWTGREPSSDAVVLRYLRAFGPASVMDVQNWSGLTRLAPVVERLRDRLVTFFDESGRELFDRPDAPRPDAGVTAPVRLLGEYDNVLLGHADRRRIIPPDFPWEAMLSHGSFVNNLLVDGMLRAT